MKIQRLSILALGALAAILATACSSSSGSGSGSTTTTTSPTQIGVREEYEAKGELPASGGITEITFYDEKIYSLKQTTGCASGEALCHEHGTYVLDTNANTLTLTPSSGSARTLPFTAGAKSGITTTAPSTVRGLHTLGGGISLGGGSGDSGVALVGDSGSESLTVCISIELLASFTIAGQSFTADIQASATIGGEAGLSIMGGGCGGSDAGAEAGDDESGDDAGGGSDGGGSQGSDSGATGTSDGGASGGNDATSLTNPLADAGLTSGDATTLTGGDAGGGSDSGTATSEAGTASDASSKTDGPVDGSAKDSGSKGSGSGSGTGSSSGGSSSGSGTSSSSSSSSASLTGPTALGIDVSHYQGTINWTKVHSAKGYAYTKATEGTTYVDNTFGPNWQGMKAAGIPRGAYHFFRASQDPIKQADFFVQTIANKGGFFAGADLAPMVDVEVTDGASASTLVSGLQKFITEAESKLGGGVKIVIYTGPSFWISTLGNPNLSSQPLWIAHYTSAAKPWIPSHWSTYTIWQYTDVAATPGISAGGVDGDRWNGPQGAVQNFITSDP